ncbi:neutral/alkaline non-lysosomal ceramidase N-terminal domain-containing protein [Paenibacillus eucommiae]|uniref:Neutral/alkaline non-lysosomal ceramidase N-terminal domain-containing protein n=1 Tax=Paenibacillus eucommiae TaxID=1355755 RepID=A0ABS4J1T4_9BACL|nr:neutral/alkaline non-lysosomal ceramidase N-terminal domain-containing protein [Paenibacillus eucommiae]MBP1993799.1 hypothetical protein [Paenibacillus eucommiae]
MNSVSLYAGTSRVNITPPVGVRLDGSYELEFAEYILDDLFANVVVMDNGGEEIVMIAADVCSIPRPVIDDIIERIEQACQISKYNVIITPSHTHASTSMGASPMGEMTVHWDYVEQVKQKMVEAVNAARSEKQLVRLGVGRSSNPNHVFNRRLTAPDGSIRMNFVLDDYEGCTSEGAVDPEVVVIKLVNEHNQAVAFIVNYALHNNAAGRPHISADISGYMTKVLQAVFGEQAVVLFLPGACGDINWIDFQSDWTNPDTYKKVGMGLAGTVIEMDPMLEFPEQLNVKMTHSKVYIPERPYSDRDTKVDHTFGTTQGDHFFEYYRKARALYENDELKVHEFHIHCLTIGNEIALLTNPAELFVEIGMDIKASSPYPYTLLATLTNGLAGYVPTKEAFEQGGYEIRKFPMFSHLAIDACDRFTEASLELLNEK